MTPITQTVLTAPGGDCFPACLASILEMPLADVPNFQGDEWVQSYHRWLRPLGLASINTGLPAEEQLRDFREVLLPGYTIIAVDSPRFPGHLHAVVARDGIIVWDPHPDAVEADYAALVWREVTYLVAMDAAKLYQTTSFTKPHLLPNHIKTERR